MWELIKTWIFLMAVTVTVLNQTVLANADAVANWAATDNAAAPALNTGIKVQGTGCIEARAAVGLNGIMHDLGANTDVSNKHLYVWMLTSQKADTKANGGFRIRVSSDVNGAGNFGEWYVGGSDTVVGPYEGWHCWVVDTAKAFDRTVGTAPALTAVRSVGGVFNLLTSQNRVEIFVDEIKHLTGIRIAGGTTGARGTFSEVAADDKTNGRGVFTEVGKVFFCKTQLTFGETGAATSFFEDKGQTVVFENADVATDFYSITVDGNATGTNHFQLGDVVGTGDDRQGVQGGSIFSAGPAWKWDSQADIADITIMHLYGVNISNARNGVLLDGKTTIADSSAISCAFVDCGEIDPGAASGGAEMLSVAVIDPQGGTAANRGLRFNATHNIKKVSMITSGAPTTQHLAHLDDTGTYTVTFDAVKYFGSYASATLWHGENSANNTNTVTISAANQANPAAAEFENTGTPAGTVAVSNDVTLKVTVKDSDGSPIQNALAGIRRTDNNAELLNALTDINGIASATFNFVSDVAVRVEARRSGSAIEPDYVPKESPQTITSAGLDTTLTLEVDTVNVL